MIYKIWRFGASAFKAYQQSQQIRQQLCETDPSNIEWQRDIIVSRVKLAEVGFEPSQNYQVALQIAQDLEKTGRLEVSDGWMVDELTKRLRGI